jgi:PAS domain S-box-containing protein
MKKDNKSEVASLRQKTEEILKKKSAKSGSELSESEMQKLIQKLEVHQIELELQNEELVLAREQVAEFAAIEKSTVGVSEFAENIINTLREPLLILDQDLRVIKASLSFYAFFKVTSSETIGKLIYDLGNNQWDIPKLRELLETILPEKTTFDDYEVEHDFSSIGKRIMLLNARQIKRAFGKEKIILLAIEDITERKLAEESLSEKSRMTSEYLDILLDHAHTPIIIWDSSMIIKRFNHEFEKLSGYDSTEVIDQKIDILFPKDKIDSTLELLNKHLSDEKLEVIEVDILTKDNDIRTVLWNSAHILDKEGDSTVATIAQDITGRKRTEEALRISEEKYRGIFENILDVYFVTSIDGTINELSPSIEIISKGGYHRDDLIGKSMNDFYPVTSGRQTLLALLQEQGSVSDYEIILKNRDGSNIQCSITAKIQFDAHGKPLKIVGSLRDITKRKQAELALRHSETHLRTLVHTIPDLIWLKDTNGMYLSCNTMFERFFGTKEADIIGKTDYDFVDQELADFFRENDHKAMEAGKPTSNEEWVTFANDRHRAYLETIKTPMFDSNGTLLGVLGIGRDITARKHAEESLKKQKDDFETIFNLVPAQIWYKDTHNNFIRVNRQACTDIGMINDKIEGHSAEELFPSFAQKYFNDDLEVFNTRISKLGIIEQVNTSKGEIRWVNSDKIPVFGNDGEINGLIAVVQDITERKRSEKALQESEERFRHSFDYAATGICLVAINGKFQRINKAFKEMTGYDDDELKNFTFNDITHPDDILIGLSQLEKLLNGEIDHASFEKRYIRKDKRILWTYVSTSLIRDINHQPQFFITQIIDITERKLAEEEIAILSHSLKSINECVSITDLDDNILFVNESFLKTYGYEKNELIGKHISIIRSQNNKQVQVDEILPATLSGEWQGELLNRKKDGSEFPIYLSTTIIKDKESKVLGLIGVATDITERKLAEKELIEAKNKAEESDRLKSAFLANMSHEVRTPLNSIIGFSELLADPGFEEEQKNEFIQSIITSGNNLLIIISDIMDISKMESGEIKIRKSQINIQRFISTVKEQFSIQAEVKKLELKVTIPDNDIETTIFTDSDRLRQVFNNLISNAIKFTANGSIEIGYHSMGTMIKFYVKDTGIGIPAEYHRIIFERFRQVEAGKNRIYGGNGLGLAISKNLVELMGGEIWFESVPGKGSTFYFTLPAYTRE